MFKLKLNIKSAGLERETEPEGEREELKTCRGVQQSAGLRPPGGHELPTTPSDVHSGQDAGTVCMMGGARHH